MARCNHRTVLVCTLVLLTVVSGVLVATPPPPVNADSFTYHLWLTVEPTGAGTVALSPAGTTCPTTPAGVTKCVTYATTSLPPNGQTVSFTATPASGYYFVAWALNGSYLSTGIPANNPDTWVMNASYALTAYFQAESYPMGQNQWVRYPENPVLTTSTNSWDSDVVYDSKPFLFPNGTFGMVYFGCCTGYGIGLAKSPDGRTWTKVSNVANGGPILLQGGLGQWDRIVVRPGSIFYDSSTSQYLLYYSGRTTYPKPSGVCGIGVAYSTDAITWTKSPMNPLINTNATTCRGLSSPSVIKVGSTYTMWYGEFGAVNIATSSTAYDNWDNGTNSNNGGAPVFTPTCYGYNPPSVPWCYGADPVLAPGPWDSDYVYAPVVVYDPAANNFKMFYSGQDGSGESPFTQYYGALDQTGFANSPDGITWTRYPRNPMIAPVPGGWDNGDATDSVGVLPSNGQLFVYYSGDTFTTESCFESGSSSAPGTGTCPVSKNPWSGVPSHFVTVSIGLLYTSEVPLTYHLWVTVEPTGAGTVKLSPAGTACPTTPAGVTKCVTYTTALSPPYGPTVSFTATPAAGYYFVAWALNGSYLSTGIPANNPDTWVMNASYALTAYFQAQNQWVRYPGNPVLTTSTNSWDSDVVYDPQPFLFPNGTFGMVYFGCCTGYGIGLAKSPDGSTWTKINNVTNNGPILERGTAGQWDNTTIRPGSIFYDSSRSQYLLYYSARNHVIDGVTNIQCGIGVAYSSDAINWHKSSHNPIFQTAATHHTCQGLAYPSVLKSGGTYMMWYGRYGAVNLATSSNAETGWTESPNPDSNPTVFYPACRSFFDNYPNYAYWCYGSDPVLSPGPFDSDGLYAPSVLYDSVANNFKMFYSGVDGSCESLFTKSYCTLFSTGFATSPDGITWTRYPGNPIISPVPGGWDNGDSTDWPGALLYNGQLFLYYSGDTFTNQTCLESGSSSVPGTGTCPISNNPFASGIPSHFLAYSIGGAYSIQSSSFSGEVVITGDSPINVLATDPLGRTVGANATTSINEIPGATYSGPGTEPQKITIPNPVPGAYVVQVFGIGVGPYHMKLQTISDVGSVVGTQDFSGQASVGSNSSFTPGLDPSGVVTPDGYGIKLSAGWNLVSLPLVPFSTKIGTVLSGLIAAKDFTVVWAYQGGKWSFAALSNGKLSGSLTTMQDGVGYWIYMTKADTLNVNGYVIPPAGSPPTYSLSPGWSLIGFKPQPTLASETVGTYLTSITGDYNTNNVWLYDSTSQSWIRADSPYLVQPGQAMWVLMTASATLRP